MLEIAVKQNKDYELIKSVKHLFPFERNQWFRTILEIMRDLLTT